MGEQRATGGKTSVKKKINGGGTRSEQWGIKSLLNGWALGGSSLHQVHITRKEH